MNLFIILAFGVLGYWWGGRAIASIHRYAHTTKVADCVTDGPKSAAVYLLLHLQHHRNISVVYTQQSDLSVRQWVESLEWAIQFAFSNERWFAIRTLMLYRSLQVLLVTITAAFIGLSVVTAVLGAGLFLVGAFSCLVAYDLCHSWTHGGGPLPSQLHAEHHARPSGNFGMWRWHNQVGIWHMQSAIKSLARAEALLSIIPSFRNRLDGHLSSAREEFGI